MNLHLGVSSPFDVVASPDKGDREGRQFRGWQDVLSFPLPIFRFHCGSSVISRVTLNKSPRAFPFCY